MKCKLCGKEVVLAPSAAERAAKLGGRPPDYTKLFPVHAKCAILKRAGETGGLMNSLRIKMGGPNEQ